jgi:hypothetical protein
MGSKPTVLYGGVLSVDARALSAWRTTLEASYLRARSEAPIGVATLDGIGAAAGVDYLVVRRPELRVGVRVEWLLAHVQGRSVLSVQESPKWGSAWLGLGRMALHVPLASRVSAYSELEAGSALRGIVFTAGGEPSLTLTGVTVRTGAGVTLDL